MALIGKVVFITGASSGIGEGIARVFARAGAKLVLGARRVDKLTALKSLLLKDNPKADILVVALDVTQRAVFVQVVEEAIAHFGHIDILINNAGVMLLSWQRNLKVDEWSQMVAVNINGVLNGVGAVLGHMRARKTGHIVNISSDADRKNFPGSAVYSGTKAFVTLYSQGLANELAGEKGNHVRVTSISPGACESELGTHITDTTLPAFTPIKMISADEVGDVVLFAVSAPPHVNVHNVMFRPLEQDS